MGGMLQPAFGGGGLDASASPGGLPGSIQAMLQGALHEWAPAQVCADGTIEVSTAKVLKNDELCVLIVVNTTTISALMGVETQLDPPRNLKASYSGEPSPQVQG